MEGTKAEAPLVGKLDAPTLLPIWTGCYGVDYNIVGNALQVGNAQQRRPKRAVEAKQNIITSYKTTDRFVPRFTLHREYRTINLNNVTYSIDKYPQMYKTGSNPKNINMKPPIYTISTITTSDFISRVAGMGNFVSLMMKP